MFIKLKRNVDYGNWYNAKNEKQKLEVEKRNESTISKTVTILLYKLLHKQ